MHTFSTSMESESPKSQIAGIQTIMSLAVTVGRKVRPISTVDPSGAGIFRLALNVVLYYKQDVKTNGTDHNSGWLVAGWIRESLGKALVEHPLLSGRLRRMTAAVDSGGLEVVANNSGVRLVEAKIPVNLPEFLELVKRHDDRAEDEVLFWKDIDEDDPQYSPLFYVQVTNFQCVGYSIRLSCSIVLADIVLGTDFLRKWSEIHNSIVPQSKDEPYKKPIFYLPKFKQANLDLPALTRSTNILNRSKPMIFQAKPANLDIESCKKIASACVKKAKGIEFGCRMGLCVSLFVKEQVEGDHDAKLEVSSRHDVVLLDHEKNIGDVETQIVGFEKLGLNEVGFGQEISPDRSSCWVGSDSDGLVFVVPSECGVVQVIVAIPS